MIAASNHLTASFLNRRTTSKFHPLMIQETMKQVAFASAEVPVKHKHFLER
jgi:hypothetical protein